MDLRDYKIKNTIICDCGHEFTIHDMKKLQRISDTDFYGGIVKHIDEITCPVCQRNTLLLIKQQGQTYVVKDIAQKEVHFVENSENVVNKNIDSIAEVTTIVSDENTTESNEIICSVCQRSFKNKSGLSIHMKTHNK